MHGFVSGVKRLLTSVGIAAALIGCCTEPAWNGKPLSAWLGQLNDLHQNRSDEAEGALRRIGTNAIPYLVTLLAATPPSFGEGLGEKQSEAVLAFRILGNSAAQSLPTLGKLLTNDAVGVSLDPYPIAQSMAGIGQDSEQWLVRGLGDSRSNIRCASLLGLIDLGEKAEDAIPSVLERLRDDDPDVRGFALFFVCSVSKDKNFKRSLCTSALQDPVPHVRRLAEKELAKLGVQ
jgi:hypothetical protein